MKFLTRLFFALAFIGAGIAHFVRPRFFEAIMPPYLPAHRALVLISGAAEVAGGVGLLIPRLRRAASWGLVTLLVAVFPANVHMWQANVLINGKAVPRWILLARLPLQFVMMAGVLWSSQRQNQLDRSFAE